MPPALSCPRLPIAGCGHPLPWLPPLCLGWWVTVGLPLGLSLPVLLSSTVRTVPTMPVPRRAEGASAPPVLQTRAHTVPDRGCSSCPLLQISGGPTASPQAGHCPKPRVSPGFHQRGGISPPERWHLPSAAQSALEGGAVTETQPATPPQTSGGEVAAGHGFVLPPGPPPGAVSTSRDDSKPWETRAPSLLILNLLVCRAAAAAQRLSGRLTKGGGTPRGN